MEYCMETWYTMKIMRSTRIHLNGVLMAGALLLAPALAFAQGGIPPASFGPLCNATGLCSVNSGGVLILANFLDNLLNTIRIVFISACVGYFTWFALMMIVAGYEENTLTEQKKAFGYSAMGLGIVGVASYIAQTFVPTSTGTNLVNPVPFNIAADIVADYITMATGGFLIFVISLAGFRMIALQGDDAEIDKQKKSFFNGLLGIVVLLLARVFVFFMIGAATGGDGASGAALIHEIAGVVKFLLEIVAALAVITLISAGFFFVISITNDERKERAKRMILSTLIVLVIIVCSHAIVATFIR